jgi:hypothetical protein
MTAVQKRTARKDRRVRRAKKAKLAYVIVNRLIAGKPTAKELADFKRLFVKPEVTK